MENQYGNKSRVNFKSRLRLGINATAQQDDQFWTLVAAILFGLATAFFVDGIRGLLDQDANV